jgi:hypothetical protein
MAHGNLPLPSLDPDFRDKAAAAEQFAQHYRGAANLVDVTSEIFAPGLQVADQRSATEDDGDVVYVERDAGLVGDGGICRTALVEPPVAATTAQAFSSAFRVAMSRGRGAPRNTASVTTRPARRLTAARSANTAGIIELPSGARPIASETMPMVLAVN